MVRSWQLGSVGLLVAAIGSCSGSCGKDKPYVPYTIEASAPTGDGALATPPPTASADATTPAFEHVLARKLPPNTRQVRVGNASFNAPNGYVFEQQLDHKEGDKADVILWTTSKDEARLLRFPARQSAENPAGDTLATLPPQLHPADGCALQTLLKQIGSRTVIVELRRSCTAKAVPEIKQWMSVVTLSPTPKPERLVLSMDEPPGAERLELYVDATDRDGDQLDDANVSVRLVGQEPAFEEPALDSATVQVPYFDRPAGLSRDPHEPGASFNTAARQIERLADGKEGWAAASVASRKLRRLHAGICSETGVPRVLFNGAPMQCGASPALERVAAAELRSALKADQLLAAVGVLHRMQRDARLYDPKRIDELRKALEQHVALQAVDTFHLPFAPSVSEPRAPSWGGLAFASDGALLVRTTSGVMRFDPQARVVLPDENGSAQPWSPHVASPDGALRLLSVADPCDGGMLRLELGNPAAEKEPTRTLPLPVLPSTGQRCAAGQVDVPRVRPIAWTAQGLELLVEGVPVTVAANLTKVRPGYLTWQSSPKGSARSADGKSVVTATSSGIVVAAAQGRGQLWRTGGDDIAYGELGDCAVANGASAVACVESARIRVFVPVRK